jgi:hypothetical protein
MKKILIVVILLLVLVPAAPVSAGPKAPVGDKMLWQGDISFPANEPFHREHGWLVPLGDYPIGGFNFVLEVDGEVIKPSYKINERVRATNEFKKTNVYNFPDGMTGVHIFTGYYYVPCQYFLDYSEGTCTVGSSVLLYTLEMTVTFD